MKPPRGATSRTYGGALVTLGKKLLLTSPRALRGRIGPGLLGNLQPEFLWLAATDACISRCGFCTIWQQTPTRQPLTADEVEATLRDPLFSGLKIVVISGGEPTLRTDLELVLARVHRAVPTARVVLSSSGILEDRLVAVVESALKQDLCIEVGLSLDGIGARHDEIRGVVGLFAKVDRTLGRLAELRRAHGHRLAITVGMVLSDATVDQVPVVRRYAEARGAVFNAQWYNQAAYYGNVGEDRLRARAKLLRVAHTLQPSVLHTLAMRVLRGAPLDLACSLLFNSCLMKCNGDIVPCFALWDCVVGNVREQPPSQIWRGSRAQEARQRVMDCRGCLNACGVLWSYDANYIGRSRFYLGHPGLLWAKVRTWVETRGSVAG